MQYFKEIGEMLRDLKRIPIGKRVFLFLSVPFRVVWSIILLSFVIAVTVPTFGMGLIFLKSMNCGDYLGERISELLLGCFGLCLYGKPLTPLFIISIIIDVILAVYTQNEFVAYFLLCSSFGLYLYIGYWIYLCQVELDNV